MQSRFFALGATLVLFAIVFLSLTPLPATADRPNTSNPYSQHFVREPKWEYNTPFSTSSVNSITGTLPIEEIANVGGSVNAIEVRDNYLYVTYANRFTILNATDPTNPFLLSEISLDGYLSDVQIEQNYAYIARRDFSYTGGLPNRGVYVVNISNPTAPTVASFLPKQSLFDIVIANGLLYVTAGPEFSIYSLNPDGSPLLIGTYMAPTGIQAFKVLGNRAYLMYYQEGIQVINITNPTALTLLGTYNTSSSTTTNFAIEVYDVYAYISTSVGMYILNISNPDSISLVIENTSYQLRSASKLYREGNYLYMGNGEFYIANVSNPTEIKILAQFADYPTYIVDFEAQAGTVYAADSYRGIRLLDVTTLPAIHQSGIYRAWGFADTRPLVINDSYLYQLSRAGLHILNTSNPSHPRALPVIEGPFGYSNEMPTNLPYVYFDALYEGIGIMNISDPTNPTIITALTDTYYFDPMEIGNGDLFAVSYNDATNGYSITRFDLAIPTAPTVIASTPITGFPDDFNVSGNYLFVANSDFDNNQYALEVYDIGQPQAITLVATRPFPDYVNGVAIANNYAFMSNYDSVLIFDISNPTAPQQIATYSVDNAGFFKPVVDGNLLFVPSYLGTVVLDITNPVTPRPIAQGSHNTYYVTRSGDYIYSTASYQGLVVEYFVPPSIASIPTSGGSLTSPSDTVDYTFPNGAFNNPATVTHFRHYAPQMPHPANLVPVDRYFEISATDATGQPVTPISAYTVTVGYEETELGFADESTLTLYRWDGNSWIPQPSSTVDATTNKVTATSDQVGIFALLGNSILTEQTYLPLQQR